MENTKIDLYDCMDEEAIVVLLNTILNEYKKDPNIFLELPDGQVVPIKLNPNVVTKFLNEHKHRRIDE
jgi:hypothetical protein